jgi:drug/metabolite transporter (DMT)-like permease
MAAARRLAGHRDLRHALVRRLHGCAVLLCLLAALAFAIAVVSQKPALRYASALQVTTFGAALARTPAAKMGATTYLVPAITVLVSWALLGQVPSGLAILGGALCLAGVALSRRRPHAPAKREPAPSLE